MKRWFALIVALQAAFILAEWGRYTIQAESGAKVVLKAVPVDPRSLFMGNYMALDLEIEHLDPRKLNLSRAPEFYRFDRLMYVGLEPGQPYARVVSVAPALPSPRPEGVVYMRGRIRNYETEMARGRPVVTGFWLDYGLERFYFPESRQEDLLERTGWRNGRQADISVTVSVTRSGHPIMRKLHVNGETVAY